MLTPDFDIYTKRHITGLEVSPLGLSVFYDDGAVSRHLAADLREHSPEAHTTHPVTRETLLSPLDVPENFHITQAKLNDNGMVVLHWSEKLSAGDKGVSSFHPGWLYQTGLSGESDFGVDLSRQLWRADDFAEMPIMDGCKVLEDEEVFFAFLAQFIRTGAVIVRGLPETPVMIETLPQKIGVIRTSNFGHVFEVKIKPEADSNAYTGEELLAHTDLATREYMPGLQFLFCLQNDADGGLSTLADGFAIAEHIKQTNPDAYKLLASRPIDFVNKAKTSDYRMHVPLFHCDASGELDEVRWTSWLRAPLRGELEEMAQIYKAQKLAYQLGNSDMFKAKFKLQPGDMMCFDNRRVLHGRTAFDPSSGGRWLRGCYMEREELWSGLRMSARRRRQADLRPHSGNL
jgi:gamma-butyrobetaine dioxygenase